MTNLEFVDELISIANLPTYYKNKFPQNCGYFNGNKYGFDCVCLIKCAMSGWLPSDVKGSYMSPSKFVCGDISEAQMLRGCNRHGKAFKDIPAYGTLLYMPGHVGIYVGEHTLLDGKVVNSIECTTSYGANKVTWSWFDLDGTRRPCKGGAKSNKKWTDWGVMDKWIDYVSINPEPLKVIPTVPAPTIKRGARGDGALNLQKCLNYCGYKLEEDGIFGTKTDEALKDWQRKNRLQIDGIYGAKSYARMKELIK